MKCSLFEFMGRVVIGSFLFFFLFELPFVTYSAALALQWDPPTANRDGLPLINLSHYQLYYGFESNKYTFHIITNKPIIYVEGLIPGSNYFFSVVAVDSNGVMSDLSAEYKWNSDSDADSIPDSWEIAHFGSTGPGLCRPGTDEDGDGYSNYQEFIAGANPTNAGDQPCDLSISKRNLSIEFPTHVAVGAGYEDLHRYYRLDASTNLTSGVWAAIPGYNRMIATNQTIVYTPSLPFERIFYRAVTWLE